MSQHPQGRAAQAEDMVAALMRRDYESLGDMPFHPDFEFHSGFGPLVGRVYHGIEGLRQWGEDIDAVFDSYEAVLAEYRTVDAERDYAVLRITAHGKESGVPLDIRMGQVWHWRTERLRRVDTFTDRREALEAVGLSE